MKSIPFIIALLLLDTGVCQTAAEIIERAERAVKGKTAHGEVEMTVVTPDFERTLRMESWWEGNDRALIHIKSPRREAGNKTLKVGNEMWNYLKNTESVIKIPPSMMLQSWNGSDFTNDDLVRESNIHEDYSQTLLGQEEVDGVTCWKIELLPRPEAPVVWGRLYYWVRIEDDLPARVQYFDEKGELIRSMNYSDIRTVGGRKIPTNWKMVNHLEDGRYTEFKILEMAFDIAISERIFSFRELER